MIAGYHWFGDWGRDTFISLPGLTLVTGRFGDAEQVLVAFAAHERNGLIPNFFGEGPGGEASYNSVDASLWYVDAVLQYVKYTGNLSFVRAHLWPVLKSIVEHYLKGTDYGIRVDTDGLVRHGPGLTWMDASVGGVPVTPREGKAVEVQALWYNALRTMALLSEVFGENPSSYLSEAETAARSFKAAFWNGATGSLFDVVVDGYRDASIRPNQILAVSLDHSLLDDSMAGQVVRLVQTRLWAAYGLRTLSPGDPRYRGVCRGDQRERDLAYHNGTVWPWLAGPLVKAFLKTWGYEKHRRCLAYRSFLQPLLEEQPYQAGLGFVSEIFDGDYPHKAGGCIAQAWSIAEPLRAYVEDILYRRPPFEDPSTWPKLA
ncbi:MAG: amylo-alpha-1,6-glucosidase [Candidatus Bathyarchaeia archaeon]